MRYLDYLPDTPYAQLPAGVKREISYEDYEARRELVARVQGQAPPKALLTRYRQRLTPPKTVVIPAKKTYWRYAAVAGWLLFVVTGGLWWSASNGPQREAEQPAVVTTAPRVIEVPTIVRDTVVQVIYQPMVRKVRDTVYLPVPVYADAIDTTIATVSRSLADGMDWQPLLAAPQPLE